MLHAENEYVTDLIAEYTQAASDRGTLDSHLEEVCQYVLPSYAGHFTNGGQDITPGGKKNRAIYDSTALIALPRFAAVMESLLTPRGSKWHVLAPLESALRRDRSVQLWMEEVNSILFRYRDSPAANFAGQNGQNYLALGAVGTSTMFIDALDKSPGLRYKAIHLGEIYFFENHQGIIDKAIRRFSLSARQAAQKFGRGVLPKAIQDKVGTPRQEDKFQFLHCVVPRSDVDTARVDYKGMPYASYYIALDAKELLREGGYQTFPFAIGRYTQAPGEVYGRSVAMEALPAVKTLNEEKKTVLRQGQKTVDPVYLVHDDGIVSTTTSKPGGVISGGVNAAGKALVHVLPTGNLVAGEKMMELERATINDAFLVTLFQILTENPQMTATEVLERVREKGILTSPTVGRQETEYLGPMIDRELDVLSRQGLLPPMPPALREAGGGYKIEYNSPLSRARRAEEATGFLRWSETLLKISVDSQDPEVLDWVDIDAAAPELGDMLAVPIRFVRTAEAVAARRDARSQAQQTQQAIDAAPAMAQVAKNIPSALSGEMVQ
jgi:hypothetical protein